MLAVELARKQRSARGGARRWPQHRRQRGVRRRPADRPVADEVGAGRPGRKRSLRRAGRDARRRRPRDAGLRAGGADRHQLDDRHCRPDARRRLRLADAQVRPDHRPSDLGRRRHGRRQSWCAPAPARTPTCSGRSAAAAATSASSPHFEFRLQQVGPQVLSGLVVHPFADAEKILTHYQPILAKAPDELTCWAVMRKAPPLPFLPAEWHGREVLILAMCWTRRHRGRRKGHGRAARARQADRRRRLAASRSSAGRRRSIRC